jgi:hypothetical protein
MRFLEGGTGSLRKAFFEANEASLKNIITLKIFKEWRVGAGTKE